MGNAGVLFLEGWPRRQYSTGLASGGPQGRNSAVAATCRFHVRTLRRRRCDGFQHRTGGGPVTWPNCSGGVRFGSEDLYERHKGFLHFSRADRDRNAPRCERRPAAGECRAGDAHDNAGGASIQATVPPRSAASALELAKLHQRTGWGAASDQPEGGNQEDEIAERKSQDICQLPAELEVLGQYSRLLRNAEPRRHRGGPDRLAERKRLQQLRVVLHGNYRPASSGCHRGVDLGNVPALRRPRAAAGEFLRMASHVSVLLR